MLSVAWPRLEYSLLEGTNRDLFIWRRAREAAEGDARGRTAAEFHDACCRELLGKPLILCEAGDGLLASLRCPHCGGRMRRCGIHLRHVLEAWFVVTGDLGLRPSGPALDPERCCAAVFAIPRLMCTCGSGCGRNFSPCDKSSCSKGATHLLLPSFILPYWPFPAELSCDLATAQEAIDGAGLGGLRGEALRRASARCGALERLWRKYGDDWWDHFCRRRLNTAHSRRLAQNSSRVRALYAAVCVQAHMNCVRAAAAASPRGDLRHRLYALPRRVPSLASCLVFLTTWFARSLASYPEWRPAVFWRNLRNAGRDWPGWKAFRPEETQIDR